MKYFSIGVSVFAAIVAVVAWFIYTVGWGVTWWINSAIPAYICHSWPSFFATLGWGVLGLVAAAIGICLVTVVLFNVLNIIYNIGEGLTSLGKFFCGDPVEVETPTISENPFKQMFTEIAEEERRAENPTPEEIAEDEAEKVVKSWSIEEKLQQLSNKDT